MLSGLSLHPDVYIFLHVLSHPLPSFCLMNFQSVRPSISTLLLFLLPHSCSFSIIYGLFLCFYAGFGWGLVGRWWGGWEMVGLHVFKQTEIFMYMCLCPCVRVTSRVPLLGLYTHVCLFVSVVRRRQLLVKRSTCWCVYFCACVLHFLPGDA